MTKETKEVKTEDRIKELEQAIDNDRNLIQQVQTRIIGNMGGLRELKNSTSKDEGIPSN